MHVVTRVTGACAVAALISLIPLQAQQAPSTPLGASAPTPRTADGHPDLSGMWGGGGGAGGGDKPDEKGNLRVLFTQRPCSPHQRDLGNCAQAVNFERDSGVEQRMDSTSIARASRKIPPSTASRPACRGWDRPRRSSRRRPS